MKIHQWLHQENVNKTVGLGANKSGSKYLAQIISYNDLE